MGEGGENACVVGMAGGLGVAGSLLLMTHLILAASKIGLVLDECCTRESEEESTGPAGRDSPGVLSLSSSAVRFYSFRYPVPAGGRFL